MALRKMDAVINLVQETLQEYDRVFLVTHLTSQEEWHRFCAVFPTLEGKYADIMPIFLLEEGVDCPRGLGFITLSHGDAQKLHKLYLTYEFSDRFAVFSDSMQYGTIFNYVDTGILTEEEAVRVIFS